MSPAVKLIKSSYSVYHLIISGCSGFVLCCGLLCFLLGVALVLWGFSLVSSCFCVILMNLGLDLILNPLVMGCFDEFCVADTLGDGKCELWMK